MVKSFRWVASLAAAAQAREFGRRVLGQSRHSLSSGHSLHALDQESELAREQVRRHAAHEHRRAERDRTGDEQNPAQGTDRRVDLGQR